MIKAIPGNKRKFLAQEIECWREENLITEEIASKILSIYPAQSSGNSLIGILMTVGAVLIGLGILLFVAANWTLLTATCKVGLIVCAMCASYYGGWYFRFSPGQRPKLGSSLMLLGAIIYGAGIWLISQIFNTDLELTNGLFIWALGVVPLAFALNSMALAVLGALLLGAWNLSIHYEVANNFLESMQLLPIIPYFAGAMGLITLLAWKLKSRTIWILAIIFGALWSFIHGLMLGELSYGTSLVAIQFLAAKRKNSAAPFFLSGGLILSLLTLLALTFDVSNSIAIYQPAGWLLWLTSLGLIYWVVDKDKALAPEGMLMTLTACAGLVSFVHPFGLFQAVSANLVLLTCLITMMFAGAHRMRSVAVLNISVVFLVLDIICRYFDFFFKTSDRSLFFVAGGFLLLITATLLENNRRKLLGDIAQ